jgi:hypothetical protein
LFGFGLLTYLAERGVPTIDDEQPNVVDAIINKKDVPRQIMAKIFNGAKRNR